MVHLRGRPLRQTILYCLSVSAELLSRSFGTSVSAKRAMTVSGGELGDQEGRLPVPGGVPGGEAATPRGAPSPARRGSIAYVLTAFPRLSETFIASEVHRLEQRGLRLRLFVLKSDDPSEPHPVVRRIAARPDYLPPTTSLSRTPLLRWLAANLPSFLPGLLRTARRRPVGVARAAWAALRQS